MEINEFKTEIYRLQKTYAGSYPDESVKALYRLLQHVSYARFQKAVDRVLAIHVNPRFPPGLDKIEKELEGVRCEEHEGKKVEKKNKFQKKVKPEHVSKFFGDILKGI